MGLEEFAELNPADVEHFLESDAVEFSDRSALEISLSLTPDRKRDVRPRSAIPINEYLSQGGHPVADSGRIIRDVGGYDTVMDAPEEAKRQVGALLSMADDSDSVPVEEWGSSSYSLNFDDDAERLLDYCRFAFIDKCLDALSGKAPVDMAKYLPEHLDGIEDEKWELLKTDEYQSEGDTFYIFDEQSFGDRNGFRGVTKESLERGKSFIQYQLGVNNLREKDGDYMVKAAPEEVEISRAVANYVRKMQPFKPAD